MYENTGTNAFFFFRVAWSQFVQRKICEMSKGIIQSLQGKFFGGVNRQRAIRRHAHIQAKIEFVSADQQRILDVPLHNRGIIVR